MRAFEWLSPASIDEAVKLLAPADAAAADMPDVDELPMPMGGGQDLLTTMKDYLLRPSRVVNLKRIGAMEGISGDANAGLTIGALTKLIDLEESAIVRTSFPGLAEAAHSIATPQIRNLGTVGGNLCQRPRCWYFRLESAVCLKKGGSQCFAATGENKYHAILGGGPSYIVHPSDLADDADGIGCVGGQSPGRAGTRDLPLANFFTLPKNASVRRENVLQPGEIITKVSVPASPMAARSTYLKFKERSSLDFAMSAVGAAVELALDGTVKQARVVLGGVAPTPWRVPKAEAALVGNKLDDKTIASAATIALEGAAPLEKNGYKVPLTQAMVRRALTALANKA